MWERLLGAQLKGGWFRLRQATGGKRDDITVVVARVEPSDGAASASRTGGGGARRRESSRGSGNGAAPESDDDAHEGRTNLALDLVEGSIGFVHAKEVA